MAICMVISGLALLAATAAILIAANEKKRNLKRNAAMVELINRISEEVKNLGAGVVPDYEEAKAAANAVNDFNKGISAILGFDPYAAYKKEQERQRNGGESEQ